MTLKKKVNMIHTLIEFIIIKYFIKWMIKNNH